MARQPGPKALPVAKSKPKATASAVLGRATAGAGTALPDDPANQARAALRTAMIEKKLTQAALADAADCHEKTIQNLLAGKPVRDQTLFDVAMVLGLDYDHLRAAIGSGGTAYPGAIPSTEKPSPPAAALPARDPRDAGLGGAVAPVYMGAYTRAGTDHLIGSYLTIRPAFSQPETYVAFRTDILWDDTWPSLLFEERERPDATYAHRGRLYIPSSSPFMHLVSLTKGAMRMILVSQIDQEGVLRGIITTLNKHKAQLVPVATPIVYMRQDEFPSDAFGEITAAHPRFADYAALVNATIDEGYARLVDKPRAAGR